MTPQRTDYVACFDAIVAYIREQEAKGLVNGPPRFFDRPAYTTHWGMHREVVLPEVKRLVAHYGCRLMGITVNWQQGTYWKSVGTRAPSSMRKTDWVHVVMWLGFTV